MIYDPIIDLNILLCAVIVVIGFCGYRHNKRSFLLYFGLAFALFGFSHLLTLVGHQLAAVVWAIFVLRIAAYLIVISVLARLAFKK
jgi:hypothetical protein